jgi:hypothetical protein
MKTTSTPNYEMFSKAGNLALHREVVKIVKYVNGKMRVTPELIKDKWDAAFRRVAAKHPEVDDSEPTYLAAWTISKALRAKRYGFAIDQYGDIEYDFDYEDTYGPLD